MRKKILAYIIAVLTITTCMIQLIPRQNNIFKIASQGEGESGFLTNNNLNQKKVYLTFDDGPSDHTDEILDILKKNKVRATFFVVGKETEHAKKMYRRIDPLHPPLRYWLHNGWNPRNHTTKVPASRCPNR